MTPVRLRTQFTPFKQKDDSACGPTCIKMVVDYFGLPYSLENIATISKYKKRNGLTNKDIANTLKKLDLQVRTQSSAEWVDLMRLHVPTNAIIVSWMMAGYIGHFSVVEKIDKNSISLADPHKGKIIRMERNVFLRLWMDYDDLWYPARNTDIELRWMAVVSLKGSKSSQGD